MLYLTLSLLSYIVLSISLSTEVKKSVMTQKKSFDKALFTQRLNECIASTGLTVSRVAKEAGISPASLRAYLRGKIPSTYSFCKICRAFRFDMDYILQKSDYNPERK